MVIALSTTEVVLYKSNEVKKHAKNILKAQKI
jgi:hypothetical protein